MVILCMLIIAVISLVFLMLFDIFCDAKNENAHKNIMIILNAIYEYYQNEHKNVCEPRDMFQSMKSHRDVFNCFWDWGYKNILPPEKFKLVEPYITKEIKVDKKRKGE